MSYDTQCRSTLDLRGRRFLVVCIFISLFSAQIPSLVSECECACLIKVCPSRRAYRLTNSVMTKCCLLDKYLAPLFLSAYSRRRCQSRLTVLRSAERHPR